MQLFLTKSLIRSFLLLFLCLLVNSVVLKSASAYGFVPQNRAQEACFATAMVGMDSVINSRLGVPAEHALELTLYTKAEQRGPEVYDQALLRVILSAYLWKESPHSYAVNVFYDCAKRSRTTQQAKNG